MATDDKIIEEVRRWSRTRRAFIVAAMEVRPQPVIGKLNNRPILVTDEDRRQARSFLDAKRKGLRDGD